MRLTSLLPVILAEIGVGTALFTCLQKIGGLRASFFTFQSYLVATLFLLLSIVDSGNYFFRSIHFPAAIFALLAARQFSMDRLKWGRNFLVMSALLEVIPLTNHIWIFGTKTVSPTLSLLNEVMGIFLLGWVAGSTILGHWYLIMRNLSFIHFQRATLQLLMAVAARTLIFGITALWIFFDGPASPHNIITSNSLFFFTRVLWGLILPGAFGFMAWRCSQTGSNQAGTGLLYIAVVSVLIGEICAGFLGV